MLKTETSYLPLSRGYLSMQYKVEVGLSDAVSQTDLVSFSPYSKESCVLFNQKYQVGEDGKLVISLHMGMKYTYSALLTAISSDFSTYHLNTNLPTQLGYKNLLLLLKSDDLDVLSEDHVLQIFFHWFDSETSSPTCERQKLNDKVRQITDQIRWQYVNLTQFVKNLSSKLLSL